MASKLEKIAYDEIRAAVEAAKKEWRELHGIRYIQIETTRRRKAAVWAAITQLEIDGIIHERNTVEDWKVWGPAPGDTTPRIFVCWNGHDETGRGPEIDWNQSADVYV
jgi:hypothetical protein